MYICTCTCTTSKLGRHGKNVGASGHRNVTTVASCVRSANIERDVSVLAEVNVRNNFVLAASSGHPLRRSTEVSQGRNAHFNRDDHSVNQSYEIIKM